MIILILFLIVLMLGGGLFVMRQQRQIQRLSLQEQQQSLSTATLYELFAQQTHAQHSNNEHHVLCLGNSITKHPYNTNVEWYAEHGMAASCPEKDYCHQLQAMLQEKNQQSTVNGYNIANWETELPIDPTAIVQPLLQQHPNTDIIIIRLGENVRDENMFPSALEQLITYCQSQVQQVVLTGNVWANAKKEAAIVSTALRHNIPYVPLCWIMQHDDTNPKVGDTIYNLQGEPYQLTTGFICTHPNDEGMRLIAKTIFEHLPL